MFSINNTLVFLILYLHPSLGYQYCGYEDELCNGEPHVACKDVIHYKEGSEPEMITPIISSKLRAEILENHNYYRNRTASGGLCNGYNETFPQATKIHELTWDFELEYLARVKTQRCNEVEYLCHNSFRYRNVGVNQGVLSMQFEDQEEMIPIIHMEEQIDDWFEKRLILNISDIGNFTYKEYDFLDFYLNSDKSSFFLMVSDRIKQVGCALTYCPEDGTWRIHIACSYSNNIIVGLPVYKIGEPASDCKKKSKTYSSLCAGESKSLRDYEKVSNG